MKSYYVRKNRKNSRRFDPGHAEVQQAVDSYLKDGGKISQIKKKDVSNSPVKDAQLVGFSADDYLRGDSF